MNKKIDKALFPEHDHALDKQHTCPECGGELVVRHGKHGPFLGCVHYPQCHYIKPLHQNDGHIVKALGVACPECQKELVLRQGRYGMFIGCSGYPDCHHIESSDQDKAEVNETITCPECPKGTLVERSNRSGKSFWACDQYPKCRFSVNQHPVPGTCQVCGYSLLVEKKSASGSVKRCANRKCQHIQEDEIKAD